MHHGKLVPTKAGLEHHCHCSFFLFLADYTGLTNSCFAFKLCRKDLDPTQHNYTTNDIDKYTIALLTKAMEQPKNNREQLDEQMVILIDETHNLESC